MKVSLFVPCFVDQFYPDVAISVVKVLERLGHTIHFPEEQICCGQPPFNAGFWDEARRIAEPNLRHYAEAEAVVVSSGSCATMFRVFYPELFKGTPQQQQAETLASRVFEFSQFLVDKLGVADVGARFPARVTFHDGCHGLRELRVKSQPRKLLEQVRDLELIEMKEAETCCGFGGTFAAKFPMISTAMGEVKCASALETEADYIVSNDSSCLMQIQGLLSRQKQGQIKIIHLAEVLANS